MLGLVLGWIVVSSKRCGIVQGTIGEPASAALAGLLTPCCFLRHEIGYSAVAGASTPSSEAEPAESKR
jgi:hypothetical protein